jgi:hypothetical protein
MIGLSLTDKTSRIKNEAMDELSRNKLVRSGWMIIALASLVGLIVAFWVVQMKHLAIDSIYVLVTGFILIGIILLLNVTQKTMDANGIVIKSTIFKTTPVFDIAAIGICSILATIYYFFW